MSLDLNVFTFVGFDISDKRKDFCALDDHDYDDYSYRNHESGVGIIEDGMCGQYLYVGININDFDAYYGCKYEDKTEINFTEIETLFKQAKEKIEFVFSDTDSEICNFVKENIQNKELKLVVLPHFT